MYMDCESIYWLSLAVEQTSKNSMKNKFIQFLCYYYYFIVVDFNHSCHDHLEMSTVALVRRRINSFSWSNLVGIDVTTCIYVH